jgi:hypothetical protein
MAVVEVGPLRIEAADADCHMSPWARRQVPPLEGLLPFPDSDPNSEPMAVLRRA